MTWLTTYGIYVFVILSTINSFIVFVDQFMVIIKHMRRFYRNRGFYQNENTEEISESDFHYFCIFVYQQIAVIFLYVFGVFVFHSMVSDTCINRVLHGYNFWYPNRTRRILNLPDPTLPVENSNPPGRTRVSKKRMQFQSLVYWKFDAESRHVTVQAEMNWRW